MNIAEQIDRLAAALASQGCSLPEPESGRIPWEEIELDIAPLRLPAELRELWERVDLARLPLISSPHPSTPDFALSGWRMLRDEPYASFPCGLFPWCYESHDFLFIELDGPGAFPGTIFEWAFAGSDFELRYRDLGDWLEVMLALLEQGAFERREGPMGVQLLPDLDRTGALAAELLATRDPHPVYGTETRFGEEPDKWPAHWAPLAELIAADPPLQYPERSVAEVQSSRRDGPVRATVTGATSTMWALAGDGVRVLLCDGTASIDIWCPPEVRGMGRIGGEPEHRIEIEVEHWTEPMPPVDWQRLAVGASGKQPLPTAGILLKNTPPEATATIVHPA